MHALRLAGICAVLLAACAQAKPVPEAAAKPEPVAQPAPPPAPVAAPVATPAPAEPVAQPVKPAAEVPVASLYFDFDKSFLKPTSRARLAHVYDAANAPGAKIRIEGNCDERGTVEYNIGLGQRRADAAKNYLVNLGIPADRIQTISYGKERPKLLGHDEESWKENRRDDIFIEGAPVVGMR